MKKFLALLFLFIMLDIVFVACVIKIGYPIFAGNVDSSNAETDIIETADNRNDDFGYASSTTPDLPSVYVMDDGYGLLEPEIVKPENSKVNPDCIEFDLNEYGLELPISGATGFASVDMPLYLSGTKEAQDRILSKGTAFTILEESENMWLVKVDEETYGWVENTYCFINLPDVIPTIIYDNTNSYSSLYRSVGIELEGITNTALYNSLAYNKRFAENKFIVPALYEMSKKICAAQHEALKNGNTLKIYEAFRPYDTQMAVCDALSTLVRNNGEVAKHINDGTWAISWFIATGVSNHQRGYAMDVSLAKVREAEHKYCGTYDYINITAYDEYMMPTKMHELSDLAVAFAYPVDSTSRTDWKNVGPASSMNEFAKLLQDYCTNAGLTPLASEWWHFNDLDAKDSVGNNRSDGKFFITESKSEIPA